MDEQRLQPRRLRRRRRDILRIILAQGSSTVTELSQSYGVSEMTIRRDLKALAEEGQIQTTHGGAVPITSNAFQHEQRYAAKARLIEINGGPPRHALKPQPPTCPAETVLKRPGSVVIWTNCRHPYYAKNPFPALAKDPKREWVGDWWPLFYAGHSLELSNLKAILEHRHRHGLPMGPNVQEA